MSDKDNDSGLVLTPGGYRPKELVQRVAPGEAVTTGPEGRMVVVRGSEAAQATAAGLTLTPGGWRPKEMVHFVEPGHVLDSTDNRLRKLTKDGVVVADLGPITHHPPGIPLMPGNVMFSPSRVPGPGSGWIAFANWTNTTGKPVTRFFVVRYMQY